VPDGSATARATDYSLERWGPVRRYLDGGDPPVDNNWVENRIPPIALGRANWLYARTAGWGLRADAAMSPIGSAKMNWRWTPTRT
jgi:hypothetical protein